MMVVNTFQGINISYLWKRKIIFKSALKTGYVRSLEGTLFIRPSFFVLGVAWGEGYP